MINLSYIESEISKIIEIADSKGDEISEERAFDYLICSLFCYNSIDYRENWNKLTSQNITDGSRDGGIDFVYFDDDNGKVVIGQNKYSNNCDVNSVCAEIEKIISTIKAFYSGATTEFSRDMKKKVLNVLDRLNEENEGNIEVIFSSLSNFDQIKVRDRVRDKNIFSDLIFYDVSDIEKVIEDLQKELNVVSEFSFDIDKSKNILNYRSEKYEGSVFNISAVSLKNAFDRFETSGLFNLNIRRYVKAKNVDEAIKNTILHEKDDFWFKNNGLTIACQDYRIDGNTVKMYNFSIVNGGQTTTLISKNLKDNSKDFYVLCKIVKSTEKLDNKETMRFYNEIAETTNSQKPIQPRDLKSNSPEMIALQKLLLERDYFLEIKRGISAPKKFKDKKLKNDDLAQLYYSFVIQKPGTARSNKKSLFSNNSHYNRIFYQQYGKHPHKIDFLVDLIQLNKRVDETIKKFEDGYSKNALSVEEMNVLSNAKLCIIALIGFIYRVVNDDFDVRNQSIEKDLDQFEYGYFISNYHGDDIDEKIEDLLYDLIVHINDLYESEYEKQRVTSISNFLKTDKMYQQVILEKFIINLRRGKNLEKLIEEYGDLFRRK